MSPHRPPGGRAATGRSRIPLSSRHERLVLAVGLIVLTSGLAWLVLHDLIARADEFGAVHHPLEPWALRVHGAAAMAFLFVLGTLAREHVWAAWQLHRHRLSGGVVFGTALLLIVTGYALYYVPSEALRPWISASHWLVGLAALPALVVHRRLGHRSRRIRPTAGREPAGHGPRRRAGPAAPHTASRR